MKLEICTKCKYVMRMIGIGLGVRCKHPDRWDGTDIPNNSINDYVDCDKFEERDESR